MVCKLLEDRKVEMLYGRIVCVEERTVCVLGKK